MTEDEVLRFFSHVRDGLAILCELASGRYSDRCWLWEASLLKNGYGACTVRTYGGKTTMVAGSPSVKSRPAHRVAYEHFCGPIPAGMHLDHVVCDMPPCANPWHLQPATPRHNVTRDGSRSASAVNMRKTHCPAGHPYDETNTWESGGRRHCRICRAQRAARQVVAREGRSEPTQFMLDRYPTCKRGHEFTEENTYWHQGQRFCRACQALRARRRRAS